MVTIQQWWRTGAPSGGERQARRGPEPHPVRESPAAEAMLLKAGRGGDRAALEELLALHKHPLYALCRGMLGHADDAEDAVQETFLHALRALSTFRGDAAFRSWLFRIAINIC